MVFLTAGFPRETAEKRLDLKSLNEQTKAEELGDPKKIRENSGTEGAPATRGPPLKNEREYCVMNIGGGGGRHPHYMYRGFIQEAGGLKCYNIIVAPNQYYGLK